MGRDYAWTEKGDEIAVSVYPTHRDSRWLAVWPELDDIDLFDQRREKWRPTELTETEMRVELPAAATEKLRSAMAYLLVHASASTIQLDHDVAMLKIKRDWQTGNSKLNHSAIVLPRVINILHSPTTIQLFHVNLLWISSSSSSSSCTVTKFNKIKDKPLLKNNNS